MNAEPKSTDERVDLMIRLALMEIAEDKWREIENLDVSDVTVSKRHDRRMRKLFANGVPARRLKKNLKKALIAALIALSVLAMLGMAIPTVRKAFTSTVVTWYDEFFEVKSIRDAEKEYPATLETLRSPALLKDWTKEERIDSLFTYSVRYTNNDDESLSFRQLVYSDGLLMIDIDNTVSEIEINGYPAMLFESTDYEKRMLQWTDGEYQYMIEGAFTVDFMRQVAESLEDIDQ